MTVDEAPRPPTDEEKTLSWVELRFLELGFPEDLAVLLAEEGADWHRASELTSAGCSPLTAARILI